jgi:hypothetical protein
MYGLHSKVLIAVPFIEKQVPLHEKKTKKKVIKWTCNAGNKELGGANDTPAIEQIIQFHICAAGGPVANLNKLHLM